jgi:hypothetical protein
MGYSVVTLGNGCLIRELRPYNLSIESFEGESQEEEESPYQARGFEPPPPPPDPFCFCGNQRRCNYALRDPTGKIVFQCSRRCDVAVAHVDHWCGESHEECVAHSRLLAGVEKKCVIGADS